MCAVYLLCYVKYRDYVTTCLCEHLLWNLDMTDWYVMICYLEYMNYEDVLWAWMNTYNFVWEWYAEMNYAMNFIISHVHAWIHMHKRALDLRSFPHRSLSRDLAFKPELSTVVQIWFLRMGTLKWSKSIFMIFVSYPHLSFRALGGVLGVEMDTVIIIGSPLMQEQGGWLYW